MHSGCYIYLDFFRENILTTRTKKHGPVLDAIKEHLEKHNVVVVSADFGHGKSLTARTLAWTLAEQYLGAAEGHKSEFPVFVECSKDFVGSDAGEERGARQGAVEEGAEEPSGRDASEELRNGGEEKAGAG